MRSCTYEKPLLTPSCPIGLVLSTSESKLKIFIDAINFPVKALPKLSTNFLGNWVVQDLDGFEPRSLRWVVHWSTTRATQLEFLNDLPKMHHQPTHQPTRRWIRVKRNGAIEFLGEKRFPSRRRFSQEASSSNFKQCSDRWRNSTFAATVVTIAAEVTKNLDIKLFIKLLKCHCLLCKIMTRKTSAVEFFFRVWIINQLCWL